MGRKSTQSLANQIYIDYKTSKEEYREQMTKNRKMIPKRSNQDSGTVTWHKRINEEVRDLTENVIKYSHQSSR